MKLRLQVVAAGKTTTFEHGGPVILVGRDPACELAFEGEASTGVSRNHARISLSPEGAVLTDAGSSNGTLHNDKALDGPVPLHVGDHFQLGYTGPKMIVLALDLAPVAAFEAAPLPAARPAITLPFILAGGGVVAAAVLAVVVGVLVLRRPAATEPTAPAVAVATTREPIPPPPTTTHPETPPTTAKRERPTHRTPRPRVEPPAPPAAGNLELAEVPVGRRLMQPEWGPSVLLARRGDAYPWAPLAADEKVLTAQPLLSLPGYRSEIFLDSKVQLTLWGNVPEFDGITPMLLESVAMLRAPETGTDLDLTLEWGRVKVANRKEDGPAHVRLRFRGEVWDLTLPDKDSEACAELWAALPPPASGSDRPTIPVSLGLFSKGPVKLRITGARHEQIDMPDRYRVSWSSTPGAPLFRQQMAELPGWWAKPPDSKNALVADAMLSVKDWADRLNGAGELVETILNAVNKSDDAGFREQAMYLLEPLNGATYLVNYLEDAKPAGNYLEDAKHARVRRAAAHALRAWLTREPGHAAELTRLLQVKVNSPTKAALILELLHPFPEDDLKKPGTYQRLIGYLKDDNVAVRELASWQLQGMAPGLASKITYDPTGAADQRQQVVAQWQKLLPPGSVPRQASP